MKTEIIFLLDRSGSMSGLEDDTIGGYNSYIKRQAELGETIVSTVLFDDKYEILYNGVPAKEASITSKDYYTRGCTALLDAVGKAILDVKYRHKIDGANKVIFVITTDGQENASQEFSYEKVNQMIKQQKDSAGWEFIFMGANIDVAKESEKLGIDPNLAFSYNATSEGTEEMYERVCEMSCKLRLEDEDEI